MKIKPLGDRVVVKPLRDEEVTASGIVLPDTVGKEKPERGEVIAVGPGKLLENGNRSSMDVKVGDKILFEKYGADDYKLDNDEIYVVEQEKIVGILE
ncbi:MAG: co-chaperone GroES [Candidatus Kerfeldbacteria bacterium]|nr:co-chaperone GroES [Candidatus Kerfeldbacteria bacterium]